MEFLCTLHRWEHQKLTHIKDTGWEGKPLVEVDLEL